jgi:hypothetical protein
MAVPFCMTVVTRAQCRAPKQDGRTITWGGGKETELIL